MKLLLCYYLLLWILLAYGVVIDDAELYIFASGIVVGSLLGTYAYIIGTQLERKKVK